MRQEHLTIAEVSLHFVNIDGVTIRTVAGNGKQGVLPFHPRNGLIIVS